MQCYNCWVCDHCLSCQLSDSLKEYSGGRQPCTHSMSRFPLQREVYVTNCCSCGSSWTFRWALASVMLVWSISILDSRYLAGLEEKCCSMYPSLCFPGHLSFAVSFALWLPPFYSLVALHTGVLRRKYWNDFQAMSLV